MNENIDHTGSKTEFADDPLNIQRHASNEKTRVFDTLNTINVESVTIAQKPRKTQNSISSDKFCEKHTFLLLPTGKCLVNQKLLNFNIMHQIQIIFCQVCVCL